MRLSAASTSFLAIIGGVLILLAPFLPIVTEPVFSPPSFGVGKTIDNPGALTLPDLGFASILVGFLTLTLQLWPKRYLAFAFQALLGSIFLLTALIFPRGPTVGSEFPGAFAMFGATLLLTPALYD